MKLSDKGYEKLNKHACTLIDPVWIAELWKDGACEEELEPDDFVGGVVLTVKEAKLIQALAKMPIVVWDTKTQKAMDNLRNQIEQAESK